LSGAIDDVFKLIDEGGALGAKFWLPHGLHWYRQSRTKYFLALGDTVAARRSLSEWKGDGLKLSDMDVIRDLEYEARLNLLEGDYASAAALIKQLYETVIPKWPRALAHHTGFWMLLRTRAEGWRPTDDEMRELIRIHKTARQMAHHDLYMLGLSYACEARGELPQFHALSTEYLTMLRFERGPLLKQLRLRIADLRGGDH
jgi:hypothetical protein